MEKEGKKERRKKDGKKEKEGRKERESKRRRWRKKEGKRKGKNDKKNGKKEGKKKKERKKEREKEWKERKKEGKKEKEREGGGERVKERERKRQKEWKERKRRGWRKKGRKSIPYISVLTGRQEGLDGWMDGSDSPCPFPFAGLQLESSRPHIPFSEAEQRTLPRRVGGADTGGEGGKRRGRSSLSSSVWLCGQKGEGEICQSSTERLSLSVIRSSDHMSHSQPVSLPVAERGDSGLCDGGDLCCWKSRLSN
ncbi:hypothetical protein AB205_0073040 [Aquarana catesbeiana]|uniref:Uncharacterized protein n=1 Tax=Aquarana catesbeiana TaxID=8400 RepID=A0A2G9Q5V7_AQUCT|nr:hypothetical protein AB205_0073040 [Aquarana catesbeiana]